MSAPDPSTVAAHPESHLALLPRSTATGVGRVDAVLVPTARGVDHLREAAELAAALDAVLVALCSARSEATAVGSVMSDVPELRWHAVAVKADHRHPLLPHPHLTPGRGGRASLSVKRNIALLVARMVGWDTVLFLDDDIRDVDADTVRLAAGALGADRSRPVSAVGLAVEDYPDSSVVCHANRFGGGGQTVFVGASALLVDVTAPELGHFPTVYNEDWLFLYDALAAGRVRREGRVRQLRYDPFGDPQRGRQEEFGDVVAEGLVAHLERGGRGVPLAPSFWGAFLRQRSAFVTRAAARIAAARPTPQTVQALLALDAAATRLAEIHPGDCIRFVGEWRAERAAWLRRLPTIARVGGVPAALRRLGLGEGHQGVSGPRTTVRTAVPARGSALIVPGFLDGQASRAHDRLARALPHIGLTAIGFDPRGTHTGPGTSLDAGPSRHLADLDTLVTRHAGKGSFTLVGHCYGGWLAGLHAARDPRVTAVVALMPTRCFLWPEDYRDGPDTWQRRGTRLVSVPEPGTSTLRAVRVPHAHVTDARQFDLPAALRGLRIPILFVAGAEDRVVPAGSVERLYEECGSKSKQITVLKGVQHDYRDHPDQLDLVERTVLQWLAEHPPARLVGAELRPATDPAVPA